MKSAEHMSLSKNMYITKIGVSSKYNIYKQYI